MKTIIRITLLVLLLGANFYAQNTFKLGFTGAYPNEYAFDMNSNVNWSWYNDLKLNMWQGWWIKTVNNEQLIPQVRRTPTEDAFVIIT
jgi:hypothetical protein